MYFLNNANTINKGIETITQAAILNGIGCNAPSVDDVYLVRNTTETNLYVESSTPILTKLGQIYEFHAPIIFKIVIEIIDGIDNGIITLNKYFIVL